MRRRPDSARNAALGIAGRGIDIRPIAISAELMNGAPVRIPGWHCRPSAAGRPITSYGWELWMTEVSRRKVLLGGAAALGGAAGIGLSTGAAAQPPPRPAGR